MEGKFVLRRLGIALACMPSSKNKYAFWLVVEEAMAHLLFIVMKVIANAPSFEKIANSWY